MTVQYYDITNGLSELNQGLKNLSQVPCPESSEFKTYQPCIGDKSATPTAGAGGVSTAPTLTTAIEGHGWLLGVQKQPISSIAQVELLGTDSGVTPPEMVFGHNQFIAHHAASGLTFQFNVLDALKGTMFKVQNKPAVQLKVKLNTKTSSSSSHDVLLDESLVSNVKELELPFDWTYTSTYSGSTSSTTNNVETPNVGIDYEKLKIREPILWFQELDLYEDELHDHGICRYSVKVRVMPSGFFILGQCWMRLDKVCMRLYESRIYHRFDTTFVLKETSQKEVDFESLWSCNHNLPKSMAYYADPNSLPSEFKWPENVAEKIEKINF